MKNDKREQICNQNTQDPDFYEAAYQKIKELERIDKKILNERDSIPL